MQASVDVTLQHCSQLTIVRQATGITWDVSGLSLMQRYMRLPCPVIQHRIRNVCLTSWTGRRWSL